MALYHKWDVKNGFAYVLTFFSLISDSLGGVISRARELQRALQARRGLPRFWHRSSFCDSQLNQVNRIGKSSFISLEFHFKDKNPILLQHN